MRKPLLAFKHSYKIFLICKFLDLLTDRPTKTRNMIKESVEEAGAKESV